jgi:predicted nucleotidyltransferase
MLESRRQIDGGELIDEVTRRLAAAAPGSKVILFGSRSRGEERPNSDVDLLVIQPGEVEKPGAETARLRRELRGLGVGFDLLVVSAEYAEKRARSEGSLMEEVLAEGRVLVDA